MGWTGQWALTIHVGLKPRLGLQEVRDPETSGGTGAPCVAGECVKLDQGGGHEAQAWEASLDTVPSRVLHVRPGPSP